MLLHWHKGRQELLCEAEYQTYTASRMLHPDRLTFHLFAPKDIGKKCSSCGTTPEQEPGIKFHWDRQLQRLLGHPERNGHTKGLNPDRLSKGNHN